MKPNPIIGSVPCPVAGCSESCSVRKFATRAQSEQGKRKAGKFYFDCPKHGRFGFDGNAAMQEHVLEHITWANEQEKSAHAAPASSAPKAPAAAAHSSRALPSRSIPSKSQKAAPASAPKAAPEQSGKKWWEHL